MTAALVTAALIAGALVHTLVVPHLLTRWRGLRRTPGEALALWQAVSVTGVVCALLAAPVAALTFGGDRPRLLAAAVLVSALMVARLLWSGHRVGTDLRRRRAQQRELVDLVGERLADDVSPAARRRRPEDKVAVVAHASPAAYCLPGRRDRIVLSQGTIDQLTREELGAVLAHEHAHLRQRHDLLLELFTVLHEAVPAPLRAGSALREVQLLAEMLADRAATSAGADPRTLARALVAMATTRPPTEASPLLPTDGAAYPAAVSSPHQVTTRLQALAAADGSGMGQRAGVLALTGGVLLLPWALVLLLLL